MFLTSNPNWIELLNFILPTNYSLKIKLEYITKYTKLQESEMFKPDNV